MFFEIRKDEMGEEKEIRRKIGGIGDVCTLEKVYVIKLIKNHPMFIKIKPCVEINDKVILSNIFKIVSGSGIGKQIAQAFSTNCKGK